MGACFPKSLVTDEVNPNTKLFNVCCGGTVNIERANVDGAENGEIITNQRGKEENELLHSLFYDVNQPSSYTGKKNVYRAARRLLPMIKR